MAKKETVKKAHSELRKATTAKRGRRHVYQAPPESRASRQARERNEVIRQQIEAMNKATARAKVLMAQWDHPPVTYGKYVATTDGETIHLTPASESYGKYGL